MYQRHDFYRHMRYLHGWFSAFAFLTLIFFAVTGLTLNHPEWFEPQQNEQTQTVQLPDTLKTQLQQENPSMAIVNYLRQHQQIVGRYQSSDVTDGEVMIRLQSPAGTTDIFVDNHTGLAEISVQAALTVSWLNELHRGKNAGTAWRWLIDMSAVLICLLSLAGFVLFLTMKSRLVTHLALTGLGMLALAILMWLASA